MERAIPFLPQQESGWDELSGASPLAANVVIDGKGTARRRPGIASYAAGDPVVDARGISGVHVTADGALYAVSQGAATKTIYRIASDGTGIELGEVFGPGRPIFAETQSLLLVACGERIRKIALASDTVSDLGGNPPRTTHVIANASRLLSVELTEGRKNQINYSATQAGADITGYEQWNGVSNSGPLQANARPDSVLALHEDTNEVFAFGLTTLQVFGPDPTARYVPIATREFGLLAPYAVVKDDQSFAWLDHVRRIVHSDGRSFSVLSDPIRQTIEDIDVTGCYALRLIHGVTDSLLWTFPADGRTFAYQRGAAWAQWQGWEESNWKPYPVTAAAQNPATGQTIVGLSTGQLGIISADAATDLGGQINAYVRTGFIDHDSGRVKTCTGVRLFFRRVGGSSVGEAKLRWRDDLGSFGEALSVPLSGDRDPVVRLWSLGSYRTRQWELSFVGSENYVLRAALEEFEVEE